jgi:hypothetical protein
MSSARIVAVALLTQENLDRYGSALKRVFRVDDSPCFSELLAALDEADRKRGCAEDRRAARNRLNGPERQH